MRMFFAYFRWAVGFTLLGLALAFWVGWSVTGTLTGALSFAVIGAVLGILEISLSFDNAIVNANTLKGMTPAWQGRFLTWGILIAVFGMRIVFPLAVVSLAGHLPPWEAVALAATEPQDYARIMREAHLSIAAFGGTFLLMVALTFFFDNDKDVHWLDPLERHLRTWGGVRGVDIVLVLVLALTVAAWLPAREGADFAYAAMAGLATFLGVDILGRILDRAGEIRGFVARGGLGAFLYLEVLDASFSFDGVIGAFALTQNPFLIAIGLGIGAFYVRSMTVMLVERGTLAQFRYLEHGAFYSVLVLSVIMYLQSFLHVPEMVTGLIGACLIFSALLSSIRHNRRQEGG